MSRSPAFAAPLAAMIIALGAWRPCAADDAARITTDTTGYCRDLAERVQTTGDMPPLVRSLWVEGRAMCEHGQVRAGLARLRRAMMIMQGGDNH